MLITRSNPNFKRWESKLFEIQKRPHNEGNIIYIDDDINFQITIVPDSGLNEAYFKICNHQKYSLSTECIRLSFFEPKYIEYDGDGRNLWKLSYDEINTILDILNNVLYKDTNIKTFWQVACHIWNREWDFAYHPDYDSRLVKGCKDNSRLLQHPQFVPLDTPMPDYTKIIFK